MKDEFNFLMITILSFIFGGITFLTIAWIGKNWL